MTLRLRLTLLFAVAMAVVLAGVGWLLYARLESGLRRSLDAELRSRAQDVKHIFQRLKAMDHDAHKLHRTVHRPWGTYTVIEEGPGFKIKRIEVKPGASLSLQMHHHRSEHWIVVEGTASVVNGERHMQVKMNESTFIPAGHRHRLENATAGPLVMIEVQSGGYLGEDDIVRFDDKYGRA